jgi:heptose I phosphotransferase
LREWRHLEWARRHGLPVPEAVAAGEFIGPWGRLQSFLAVKELTDMVPLHLAIPSAEQLLAPKQFQAWKRRLISEIACLARNLHAQYRFHKDFYLCHFYVPRELVERASSWSDQVHLIDLHRLKRHRLTWRFWQIKDLAQLLYSSEIVGVDDRDRLRFWRAYLRDERGSWLAELLRRCVVLKWRRYRRHNTRIFEREERRQAQGVSHEHCVVP